MDVNIDSVRTVDLTIEKRLQVSRMEIVDSGRRRRFSNEAKLAIVAESYSAPRQVTATARRHGITRFQLNDWRKAAREGRLGRGSEGFVPALLVPEPGMPVVAPTNSSTAQSGLMEVVSANGRRVIVGRDVDVEALLRILRGLEALR
ncbi:IS66-like element accessory protein TnpA [Ensifer aridi]|uniref:IS66-like element accessory protein TnpA n=1 Tax=Ensifer aridi TaxID=1708715 RepID=UPI000A11AEE7|nr:transposase [Ensifer aridi]